jgi:hypothetical protein
LIKVVMALVLVMSISLIIGYQNAYAAQPDCTTAGIREGLTNKELYVGDEDGKLWKVHIDDGLSCSLGTMKTPAGATVRCTDVGLDPTTSPATLYCITFSDLYTIDRDDVEAHFIGNLMDGIVNVVDMNAMEIDSAGVAYAAAISGNFYGLDLTDGSLSFRKDLGHPSAGDLAWYPPTGKMYWTSTDCPGCVPIRNGLFVIDLVTDTATFIDTTTLNNVFAGDFLPGQTNMHFVNLNGRLVELEKDADIVGAILVTDPLVRAYGGTANTALVGGLKVALETSAWLLGGIYTSPAWLTPAALGVVALVAFKLKKKN